MLLQVNFPKRQLRNLVAVVRLEASHEEALLVEVHQADNLLEEVVHQVENLLVGEARQEEKALVGNLLVSKVLLIVRVREKPKTKKRIRNLN